MATHAGGSEAIRRGTSVYYPTTRHRLALFAQALSMNLCRETRARQGIFLLPEHSWFRRDQSRAGVFDDAGSFHYRGQVKATRIVSGPKTGKSLEAFFGGAFPVILVKEL